MNPVGLESDYTVDFDQTTSTNASISVTPPPQRRTKRSSAIKRNNSLSCKPLIIFDWDDTILPTSWLNRKGYRLEGPSPTGEAREILDELSLIVNETLTLAAKRGHVMIVTNAEDRWIGLTAEKFMPLSAKCVAKFQHISARSMFEPTGLALPIEWKENAFRMVVEEYLRATSVVGSRQVISIGDSAHEREAVLKVCGEVKHHGVGCKSLKFMERPDVDNLKKEHILIQECFRDIIDHKGDLDLCIQPGR